MVKDNGVQSLQSSHRFIPHPNAPFGARPSAQSLTNKAARVLVFGKADGAVLPPRADTAPVEINDPMTEQIKAGMYAVTTRDIAGRVNGLQMQADNCKPKSAPIRSGDRTATSQS